MFDLVTGKSAHIPNRPTGPIVVASIIEAIVLLLVIVVPVLFVTGAVPEVPTMMAFVAAAPAPPPPPPPPAAPAQAAKAPATKTTAVSADAAPVEAPRTIEPETVVAADDQGTTGGVEGGVPSGVPGGTIGGVIGEVAPPPPPPPAPVAPRGPVRIGGQLQAPALLKRVEPIYPPLAVRAHMTGVVVLEATVDGDGKVVEAAVLRSAGPLLDREALIAVKQWRYSPLLLNGRRESFILTVTLSFNVAQPTG